MCQTVTMGWFKKNAEKTNAVNPASDRGYINENIPVER
jgi:hypothetical protein